MGAVSNWGEFGLIGAVVGALFAMCGLLVRWAVSHVTMLSESHATERAEWRQSIDKICEGHGCERRDWAAAQERRDNRVDEALDRLSEAIRGARGD